MALHSITPEEAKRMIGEGALLVDIREADEYARERIPGALHVAVSQLDTAALATRQGQAVIFHCRSGMRTEVHAAQLADKIGPACQGFVLEGGLDAWKKAGFPVSADRRQPVELQRQVQIAAGAMAFVGTLLGLLVSEWFLIVPGFVGVGLVVAGITGFCGLARLLRHMPWNQSLMVHRRAG